MTTTLPEVDETTLVEDEPDVPCDVSWWIGGRWVPCGKPAAWDVITTCDLGPERIAHECDRCHLVAEGGDGDGCGYHDSVDHTAWAIVSIERRRR